MKFGYEGKHVQKGKHFKLYSGGGKRLAEKSKEDTFFYQTMQLVSGKVKYLFSRVKQFGEMASEFFDEFGLDEFYDEEDVMFSEDGSIDSEETYKAPIIERLPSVSVYNGEENPDNIRIANLDVSSLDEIEDVIYFLEEGCIVLVNYSLLSSENRAKFDKKLSMELMLRGTHLVHITKSVIVCASNHIFIEDKITPKKDGKVYDLSTRMRR